MTNITPLLWVSPTPILSDGVESPFHVIDDNDSLFQDCLERLGDPDIFTPPLVIGDPSFLPYTLQQAQEIDFELGGLVPLSDTDPLSVLSCILNQNSLPDDQPLILLPCNHWVQDFGAFEIAAQQAAETAKTGRLVSFGVVAQSAEPNRTYLKPGERLNTAFAGHHILDCQTPGTTEQAQSLLDQGGYVWDTGIYSLVPRHLQNEIADAKSLSDLFARAAEKVAVTSLLTGWQAKY